MQEVDFSNAVRLSGRQWVGVGIFTAVLILGAAPVWERVEKFEPDADYRMPYELSNDYWLYERYARLAALHYDTLIFGDSVVWGQYVTPEETLSHYLNEEAGEERFANLGLDGVHPIALAGLIEHYAGDVRGKNVILQCNPLWMSSPERDLQKQPPFGFNHPRLVPQFFPTINGYKEEISPRIGIALEQRVAFRGWTNHLQQVYYNKSDIPTWTLEHPYENPFKSLVHGLPAPEDQAHGDRRTWIERGSKQQDMEWIDLDTSLQWQAFRHAVEVLQERGNHVFVLVGPFNEHLLTEGSLERYRKVQAVIEGWLREKGVAYLMPKVLPSGEYADASHPLREGYGRLAREVFGGLR